MPGWNNYTISLIKYMGDKKILVTNTSWGSVVPSCTETVGQRLAMFIIIIMCKAAIGVTYTIGIVVGQRFIDGRHSILICVSLQVIQQVHSASGGGKCCGCCSHRTGGAASHTAWEVGTHLSATKTANPLFCTLPCTSVCCVCVN